MCTSIALWIRIFLGNETLLQLSWKDRSNILLPSFVVICHGCSCFDVCDFLWQSKETEGNSMKSHPKLSGNNWWQLLFKVGEYSCTLIWSKYTWYLISVMLLLVSCPSTQIVCKDNLDAGIFEGWFFVKSKIFRPIWWTMTILVLFYLRNWKKLCFYQK